jgi:hypothetical protein
LIQIIEKHMPFSKLVNTIGLIAATIGSVLVWFFLTEISTMDKDKFLKGVSEMRVEAATPEAIKKFKCQLRLSQFGLFLIILGGVLQGWSNFIND